MKVVILAGGYGTRISEESKFKPKPMIEIGGMPILWHIMKEYSYYGFNDFVICAGYKQHMIKEWFADYFLHTSDVTFDFTQGNKMIVHDQHAEPWRVTVVDTGLNTMTGGRIKRVQKYIGNETFMMTYGDGVCDVNIAELVKFHKQHGKLATLTAVVQEQQKGVLDIGQDNTVQAFREKSINDGAIINAGYMVLEPEVFDTISGDDTIFEQTPLRELAAKGQLMSVDLFCQAWGDGAAWENRAEANAPHEANFLKLDCSKLKSTFGWKPRWHMAECMQKTVAFSKVWLSGGDIPAEMDKEIKEFLSE